MKKIMNFFKDEDGLELSEYAIMGGLIILLAVGIITTMGGQINTIFTAISGALGGAITASGAGG